MKTITQELLDGLKNADMFIKFSTVKEMQNVIHSLRFHSVCT